MRQASFIIILIILLALIIGCSGDSANPMSPEPVGGAQDGNLLADSGASGIPPSDSEARQGVDSEVSLPEFTNEKEHPLQGQLLQGSHALWGLYQFAIDTEADSFEIVPLRVANLHLNAVKFLEPGGFPGMIQLVGGLDWSTDKTTLDINLQITHPFPSSPQFSGFDVKGILITKGTLSGFSIPGLVMSGSDELRVMNADGYSRWWNPEEFPGNTIFSYIDGALGMKDSIFDYTSTLNGYKYFCDSLESEDLVETLDQTDRGVFRAGESNVRHYTLSVPVFPTSLIFNYAIDASWEPPLTKPPVIPDDFPLIANQPEPWHLAVSEIFNSIYFDSTGGEQGGQLVLEIDVYDWQSPLEAPAGSIVQIVGEWPGIFDVTNAAFVSDEGDYAVWQITLEPIPGSLTSTDDINYLIWAESSDGSGYGGILDLGVPLVTASLGTAEVLPEKINTPPVITDGVSGNGSPGLVTEQYSVSWIDPDPDTITVMWSVEEKAQPYNFDDPGNGDGTIDISWTVFGEFTVQCQVSDGVNPPVEATPLDVLVGNTPPDVGQVEGPDDVSAADTAAVYTVPVIDPDTGQTHTYLWSVELDGDPEDFSIPGDVGDGSLELNWSTIDPGVYSINAEVSDGFAQVSGTALTVTHNNTPPTVGDVDGKTPVTNSDTNELYQAAWSDPDTTQTLGFLWSVVPEGDAADYTLPSNPDGSINLDWSGYTAGTWDVNVLADDGIDQTEGTLLTVKKVDNDPPTAGAVSGPTPVYHTDTASDYSVTMNDPEADPLTVLWSVVPHGDPADYSIPGDETNPLTVDWSTYPDLGEYDINVQVDDSYNPPVEGTLLTVSLENTLPTVGAVAGPTPVDGYDTTANYSAPINDPDTAQVLSILWSVVPSGSPSNYVIPDLGGGSVDIDWSGYNLGLYDVNVRVDDGFGAVEGTLLTVNRINTVPNVGPILGPDPVDCTDVSAHYSSAISDADTAQTLTILWSVVPNGDPANYIIVDNGDGSVDINWQGYEVGTYDVNVRADDGVVLVEGTLYEVTRINTLPDGGDVTGPTPVSETDVENYYVDPSISDCDTTQTLEFAFSIVPKGDPENYSIPSLTDDIDIDWSVYGVGEYTVGCRAYDDYEYFYATPLDVTVTLGPCEGHAHTYLGSLTPNKYSIVPMSVLPRADIAFLDMGSSFYEGLCVAQTGPHTIGVFNADSTGVTNVQNTYNLGKQDAAVSIDTEPIEGRIIVITAMEPDRIKILDSSTIMGNPIISTLVSGNPLITWIAADCEGDGDFWAVRRDATTGVTYSLVRFTFQLTHPYYMLDPVGTLDITPQVGTDTDIFDIAINHSKKMLYLLEGGAIDQGTMQTYLVQDGSPAYFMGTLGSVLFSQPLDFDESAFTGFAGYGDIEVDHVDGVDERCRILLYGRLEDLSSELIRMDSAYNVLDVQNYSSAWPAFTINTDLSATTRNLIMPSTDQVEYWDTPVDW